MKNLKFKPFVVGCKGVERLSKYVYNKWEWIYPFPYFRIFRFFFYAQRYCEYYLSHHYFEAWAIDFFYSHNTEVSWAKDTVNWSGHVTQNLESKTHYSNQDKTLYYIWEDNSNSTVFWMYHKVYLHIKFIDSIYIMPWLGY